MDENKRTLLNDVAENIQSIGRQVADPSKTDQNLAQLALALRIAADTVQVISESSN